jgi:hypothetical protein
MMMRYTVNHRRDEEESWHLMERLLVHVFMILRELWVALNFGSLICFAGISRQGNVHV